MGASSGNTIGCRMSAGGTQSVRVVVSDFSVTYPVDTPVTNFQVVNLTPQVGDPALWTAPAPDLGQAKTVSFVFIANRDDGFGLDLYAQPAVKTVQLWTGSGSAWMLYE